MVPGIFGFYQLTMSCPQSLCLPSIQGKRRKETVESFLTQNSQQTSGYFHRIAVGCPHSQVPWRPNVWAQGQQLQLIITFIKKCSSLATLPAGIKGNYFFPLFCCRSCDSSSSCIYRHGWSPSPVVGCFKNVWALPQIHNFRKYLKLTFMKKTNCRLSGKATKLWNTWKQIALRKEESIFFFNLGVVSQEF